MVPEAHHRAPVASHPVIGIVATQLAGQLLVLPAYRRAAMSPTRLLKFDGLVHLSARSGQIFLEPHSR